MTKPRHVALLDIIGSFLVLALVVAMLVPMLAGRGEAAARSSTCLENMKQIGASIQMYSAGYDDVYPRTTVEKRKRGFGAHWTYLIQPFVRSEAMFVCPADVAPSYTYIDSSTARKGVASLSYINNYSVIPAHDFYPVDSSTLDEPARIVMIGERRSSLPARIGLYGWKGTSGFVPGQPCRDQEEGVGYRKVTAQEAEAALYTVKTDKDLLLVRLNWTAHGDGANYAFSDGHARHQTLAETLDPGHFEWGDKFYPRSMDDSKCDGRVRRRHRSAKYNK